MTASTGIHHHDASPPIGWGKGCDSCDRWAIAGLGIPQRDALEEHIGELDRAGVRVTAATVADLMEQRERESRDVDPVLADDFRAIRAAVLGLSPEEDYDDEPEAPPLPESLVDAGEEVLESLDRFAHELYSAGGRDSDLEAVRHFCAYHLADIEGNDRGGGWLASKLLADEIRALLRGEEDR